VIKQLCSCLSLLLILQAACPAQLWLKGAACCSVLVCAGNLCWFVLSCLPLCRDLQDVADLARLKILGGKLKKSSTRKEPPSAVLQAMQQQRQGTEGQLASAEGMPGYAAGATGLSGTGMLTPTSASAAGGIVGGAVPMKL
jgi:hypothetical protein